MHGIYILTNTMEPKRLSILHDLVPQASMIAALVNPKWPPAPITGIVGCCARDTSGHVRNDGGFSMSTASKRRRSELQQAALEAARIQAAHQPGRKEADLLRLLSQDIPEQRTTRAQQQRPLRGLQRQASRLGTLHHRCDAEWTAALEGGGLEIEP